MTPHALDVNLQKSSGQVGLSKTDLRISGLSESCRARCKTCDVGCSIESLPETGLVKS